MQCFSDKFHVLTMQGNTCPTKWLCKAIYVQRNDTYPMVIPRIRVCVRQVPIGESWFLDTRPSEGRYIPQWKTNEQWPSSVMYLLSLDPVSKNQLSPIRTCLMHVQIHGMTVGYVSFRRTYIALHTQCDVGWYKTTSNSHITTKINAIDSRT